VKKPTLRANNFYDLAQGAIAQKRKGENPLTPREIANDDVSVSPRRGKATSSLPPPRLNKSTRGRRARRTRVPRSKEYNISGDPRSQSSGKMSGHIQRGGRTARNQPETGSFPYYNRPPENIKIRKAKPVQGIRENA